MKLYNEFFDQLPELVGKTQAQITDYRPGNAWPESSDYEMVLQRDMAFELGEDATSAVNYTCITTDSKYFEGDRVEVYGPDLKDIKGKAQYARITLILSMDIESDDEDDTETAFRAIQDMDFIKYHVYPKGFMVRTSGMNNREQIRVSKDAVKQGISFEKVGNTFIKHYKENPNVRAVRIIFITADDADYASMKTAARKVSDITKSLSQILEGMPTDCGSCGLKDICDEVEGLKELHFGQKDKKQEGQTNG